MPLSRYREAGLGVGLGSDVAGGPDPSIFSVMQVGAYAQAALRTVGGETRPVLTPFEWLRLGTLDGARALGLDDRIGSLEAGKEADLIAVDPRLTAARRDLPYDAGRVEAEEVMSRLIFRAHPDMVRGAWVRGRRLDGPPVARRVLRRPDRCVEQRNRCRDAPPRRFGPVRARRPARSPSEPEMPGRSRP